MSNLKVKYEFLKRVKPITKEQFEKIKSQTLVCLGEGEILYSGLVKEINTHKTTDKRANDVTKQNINTFLETAYREWRKLLGNGSYKKGPEIDKFLNDPKFDPDSEVFKSKGYTIEQVMSGINLKKFHPEIYSRFGGESGNLYAPVHFQDFSFIHVQSSKFYPSNPDKQKTECRLYLNLKSENIGKVAMLVMGLGKQKGLPLYYKFARNDSRNDTFLFYCSYEEAGKVVDLIEEIKAKYPKLFEGTEKVASHLGTINGYIGFAEEPTKKTKNLPQYVDRETGIGNTSYTEVRADALAEIHQVNYELRNKNISENEAKKRIKAIKEKYDISSVEYLFLNQSTIDEMEKYSKENNNADFRQNCK